MHSKVNILVTGIGAPGAPGIIKSLRLNGDREFHIVGVDANLEESIGVGLVDASYKIPSANSPEFVSELMNLCKKENVQVLLPLVTNELFVFSKHKSEFAAIGVTVLVSSFEALNIANSKARLIDYCNKIGVPTPVSYPVKSYAEFEEAASKLGYPKKTICFKPPISNGLRGFRIVQEVSDRMNSLLNEKPNNVFISYDEFRNICQESTYFPELLVMEYLPGKEYSVDALGDGARCVGVIPRTRDKIKMGISFVGSTIDHQQIREFSSRIIDELGLYGNIGFQFREDENGTPKIIESNPRVQGTIVLCTASGYNMVYNAVRIALNEKPQEFSVNWGTKMVRYWDELFFINNKRINW